MVMFSFFGGASRPFKFPFLWRQMIQEQSDSSMGSWKKKLVLNISGAYLGGGFWQKTCFVGLIAFAFCYDAVGLL